MTERRNLYAELLGSGRKAGDGLALGLGLRHADQSIVLGDSLELLKAFPPKSVNVVMTSPPYNIGTSYRTIEDAMSEKDYAIWIGLLVEALGRVLTDEGSIFLNMDGCALTPWQAHDVAQHFRERFVLQNEFAWIKSISMSDKTYGHFKPLNSKRFVNRTYEKLYHFTRRGDVAIDRLAIGVPYEDKTNLSRWSKVRPDRRCAGNAWFVPYETVRSREERANHPATFPVELARRCLRLAGASGVVLDPFVGTGSTLVAAHELGMKGIGMEIDLEYAWSAYKRLQRLE